jgi:hypothetical protein
LPNPVGQLDKNTTGLMLFTREGEISNYLNLPGNVTKTYVRASYPHPHPPIQPPPPPPLSRTLARTHACILGAPCPLPPPVDTHALAVTWCGVCNEPQIPRNVRGTHRAPRPDVRTAQAAA